MLFFYLADLCGRRAASLAPLCKGSCRRSGLSGCFSLRLRTVMTLRDIPVFRSAYSASRNARASAAFAASIKAHCAVGTETLMLQVRSAHPPMPHRTSFSSCSGVPVGLFSDSAPTHLRCAGVPLGLFGKPKRSSFSRVRGLHQAILWPLLQNARPSGSLRSPSDAAP